MTPQKPHALSLGFIGGGLSSAVGSVHYSACHLDGIWELHAGSFSRNKEKNKETAKMWKIDESRTYDHFEDMLEKEKNTLNAICILTDTPSHSKAIEAVLKKEIPIICEKSIAMDTDETAHLQKIFDPKKHFFASIFNYTGYPMLRELKELISIGEFGKIQQIHIEMPQESFIRPSAVAAKVVSTQHWRLKDGKIPTVCLDLGVHMHNMITFLTGEEPSETFAEFGNYSKYKGLIDYIQMLLRFKSQMKGSLLMTKTALGHRNGLKLRIYGEKASASWYQMEPEELKVNYLNGQKITIDRGGPCHIADKFRYNRFKAGHPSGFIEAFANLYADIADALEEFKEKKVWHNPYVYGFDDAVKGLKLFEAAVQSYQTQKWAKTGL
jgi:predicted dehydrogenase